MEARSSNPVRAVALVLAIGINALYLLLLSLHRATSAPDPIAPAMIWIAAIERPRASARRPATFKPLRATKPAPLVVPVPQPVPEPATDVAPPTPSIDWRAESAKAAQDFSRRQQQAGQASSVEAAPEVRVRPESDWIPRKAGTVEHFEGGVLRQWVSDLCFREYNPMEPDPFTGGFRKGGRQVCKKRSMSERGSEARAEAVADAVKQKRSGTAPAQNDKEVDQWIP
jgi:hypothetical protein